MSECDKLHCCGFFQKYGNSKNIDCRGFIEAYCKGSRMTECARLGFFKKFAKPPVDEMMPSGKIMESAFTYQPYSNDVENYY